MTWQGLAAAAVCFAAGLVLDWASYRLGVRRGMERGYHMGRSAALLDIQQQALAQGVLMRLVPVDADGKPTGRAN